MARRTPRDGEIDVVAAYRDARAVPLAKAAELLDLIYPDLGEDEIRDQIIAPRLWDGRRLRLLGYEHPRRMSDTTVLVPKELVRRAFQDLRAGLVYDPVHDCIHVRPRLIGTPPPGFQETSDGTERRREMQRRATLPPAVDWQGCRVRAGRYAYVNVKAIRAEDLAGFATIKGPGRRPGARRGKRRGPKDKTARLDKMIETLRVGGIEAPEAAEVIIEAHPEVLYSRPDEKSGAEVIVNPRGWWAYGTLVRLISDRQRNKTSW